MTAPTSPALPFPVLPDASVESCIVALVAALQQSKGWMHGYADAIVRDAVDRVHLGASPLDAPHHPEPHTHTWTDMEKRCILAWGGALVARQAAEKDAEIAALKQERDGFVDQYMRFAEAMHYTSGKDGMEFSPEEWATAVHADAERYRWLRDASEWEMFEDRWLTKHDIYGQGPADLDAAIDASRALAQKEAKS